MSNLERGDSLCRTVPKNISAARWNFTEYPKHRFHGEIRKNSCLDSCFPWLPELSCIKTMDGPGLEILVLITVTYADVSRV